MNQTDFNRRQLMALMGSAAVAAGLPGSALAQDAALKFWAPGIAKVGEKDWSDMAKQSGVEIAAIAKSARADESIQKMVVGDGNALYDAMKRIKTRDWHTLSLAARAGARRVNTPTEHFELLFGHYAKLAEEKRVSRVAA